MPNPTDQTNTADITHQDGKRKFAGTANSGKPFNHNGKATIVDLSDISFAPKVPILLTHDRDKRVGFGTLNVIDNQLVVEGELLDNADATRLACDSDNGFPWQMSAHIIAEFEENLEDGQGAIVNGQTITGEIKILRKCRVSEVSFTPTGVDNQTTAVILSQTPPKTADKTTDKTTKTGVFMPNKKADSSDNLGNLDSQENALTDLQKQIGELKKQIEILQAKNAQLKADKQKIAVEAKLSQKGYHQDTQGSWQGIEGAIVEVLLSMETDQAMTMIDAIRPKAVPEFLLSEQYNTATDNAKMDNPLLADAKARK